MSEFYDNFWQQIHAGGYKLADMLARIDLMVIAGRITGDERDDLMAEAQANADPAAEYPSDLRALYEALAARVSALEALHAGGGEGGGMAEEWPEYIAPTGSHDAYHTGDKITYNGVRYTCVAPEGTAVVWPPDVYPAYWEAAE